MLMPEVRFYLLWQLNVFSIKRGYLMNPKRTYTVLWDKINELSFSEVCGWLDIPIKRDTIKCPNPLHEDKNPSCKIKDDTFCHCFACGYGGGPLKLIQTKLELSKWEAIRYINQHIKCLEILNELDEKDLYLTPWELGCLELKDDPLLTYSLRVPISEEKTKTKTGTLPKEVAYALICDKYISCCPTQNTFLQQFKKYVLGLLQEVDSKDFRYKSPSLELWKYTTNDSYQKALRSFEEKRNHYFLTKTGLNYPPLLKWHLEGRGYMVEAAIQRIGTQHYKEFQKKMDQISELMESSTEEKQIEQEESLSYGR